MKGNLDHHFRRHHHQHHHVNHVPKNPQVPVGLKAVKGEKDTGEESSFAWNERDGEEGHRSYSTKVIKNHQKPQRIMKKTTKTHGKKQRTMKTKPKP